MKLNGLLEAEPKPLTKSALQLQQILLEHWDKFNPDIELNPTVKDTLTMRLTFENYPAYKLNIDLSLRAGGIEIVLDVGAHSNERTYLATMTGQLVWDIANPELLARFDGTIKSDIAGLVSMEVAKRAATEEELFRLGRLQPAHSGMPESLNSAIPKHKLLPLVDMIANAALEGLHVQCKVINSCNAGAHNRFNDEIYRRPPKPRQLSMWTDYGLTYFLYASHEAPTAA